ncbi:MAG: hypothetical protein WCS42_13105 [Verrucomicrobiota bacterium]
MTKRTAANQETKPWENWDRIAEDCDSIRGADISVFRDAKGGYHLLHHYDQGKYLLRDVSKKEAADFCLKAFIPDELHDQFSIK